MVTRLAILCSLCGWLLLSMDAEAKGGDGLVLLKGTIQGTTASDEVVSFAFSGRLSFSFFTAQHGDPDRKRIDLKFDVRDLPVQIPRFGNESDCKQWDVGPFCVSFENAGKYAAEVAKTGELVNVALFSPTLSYDINGLLERATCTHAHVVPERSQMPLSGLTQR